MSENGDGSNGRVTMAVLGAELRALREDVQQLRSAIEARISDHETRLRTVEQAATLHEQRLGVAQGGQALLTLVGSAAAAWFGSRP